MQGYLKNWMTQIKKGYLELCILEYVSKSHGTYGLQIISELKNLNIELKEGTLYPLLNRMSKEGLLNSYWNTKEKSGHPRKMYKLSSEGDQLLACMKEEFTQMDKVLKAIGEGNE